MHSKVPSQGSDTLTIAHLRISELEKPPKVSRDLLRFAECELNETPERRAKCLECLRDLLKNDETLRSRTDPAFLLRFLRPAKFDASRAHRMIQKYYRIRRESQKMFTNAFTPADQRETFKYNLTTVLPHKDSEGRTLFLLRCGAWNPSVVSKDDFFMSTLQMMELSIRDVQTLIKGTVVIVDMAGLSMTHIFHLSPTDLGRIISLIQDCFPCRIKAIHIVNQPTIFSIIWNIIKGKFTSKMSQRLYLHGHDLTEFHKQVDPKCLPDFLGGEQQLDVSANVQELMGMNDVFFHDAAYGYIDYTKNYKPRH